VLFTGDTLIGSVIIAAALGFWLGERYGWHAYRARIQYGNPARQAQTTKHN